MGYLYLIRKKPAESAKARRLLEQVISVEQTKIDKLHSHETELIDLFTSKGITEEQYRAKKGVNAAQIEKHEAERQRLTERLGEHAVLALEQAETLQHFQHEIASCMTDDVPAVERMQLFDLLRVECMYNSEIGELLINGLMGQLIVDDI